MLVTIFVIIIIITIITGTLNIIRLVNIYLKFINSLGFHDLIWTILYDFE